MRSLVNHRRFSFGRRKTDHRPSVALMSVEAEKYEDLIRDVCYMLRNMPGAKEYLQEVLAEAQASGFSFEKINH